MCDEALATVGHLKRYLMIRSYTRLETLLHLLVGLLELMIVHIFNWEIHFIDDHCIVLCI